jgi:hypothetical protein
MDAGSSLIGVGDRRPGMTSTFVSPPRCRTQLCDLAAPRARVLPETSRPVKSKGAGNAGRSLRPQPCVRNKKAHKHSHHGHTGNTRHSPRNGFNGFLRALLGDRACLPPSSAKVASRQLDASVGASGPHDFAVRKSAPSSEAPPASTASRPAFVTIASRPSVGQDGASL